MSVKNRGLGRGISSLISGYDNSNYEAQKLESVGVKVQNIPLDRIQRDENQPRKNFDIKALEELSESISAQGVIQPILVREIAKDSYAIVAGERRFRAAKMAGLKEIPCLVRTFTDIQRMEVALIENIQRENLNPVEEAKAYQYLLSQQEIKHEDLAKRLGKSRSAVTNSLRLLALPENMLRSLENSELTSGHARALLSLENPADREVLYCLILKNAMSVREAEAMAAKLKMGVRAVNRNLPGMRDNLGDNRDEMIIDAEEKFLGATGCQVKIKGKLSKGRVVIPFSDADELERIYQLFCPGQKLFDTEDEE